MEPFLGVIKYLYSQVHRAVYVIGQALDFSELQCTISVVHLHLLQQSLTSDPADVNQDIFRHYIPLSAQNRAFSTYSMHNLC